MNKDNFSGKWKEIKGEIRNQWGKLTDDEIESTKGNMTAIQGLIQQRYGDSKDASSDKLGSLFSKFGAKAEEVKDWMSKKSEDVKESLRDSKKS